MAIAEKGGRINNWGSKTGQRKRGDGGEERKNPWVLKNQPQSSASKEGRAPGETVDAGVRERRIQKRNKY